MIQILNVSKKFRIWEDRSRDLKETTINWLRGKKRSFRELWALREINLEIGEGETVAFIGENGSGKSTLLKLLSGIYTPDEGKVVTRGKISALLELGVGFHPDLTGEENVYLNGAMLGFNRSEMKRKFDEIVSFSEIGDFIYSPIRTYSSGMIMRLGFSIATCVDPDILLIDEILAVGDEAFQNKCQTRLDGFKAAGKTLVLVSHSMETVQEFCERVILLHEGRMVCDDVPEKTIDAYHTVLYGRPNAKAKKEDTVVQEARGEGPPPAETSSEDKEDKGELKEEAKERQEKRSENIPAQDPSSYQRSGTLEAEITQVQVKSSEQEAETDSFTSGEMISIHLRVRFHQDVENPVVGISILRYEKGETREIYSTNTLWQNMNLGFFKGGHETEVVFLQRASFAEGRYYLTSAIANGDISHFYDWHENVKSFQIIKGDPRWKGIVDLNSQILISESARG